MFSLLAFSESQDEAGAFALVNAVADQHVRVETTRIIVPAMNQLIGEAAFPGSTGAEVRLVSPSLRRLNPLYITPIELALVPGDAPATMFHPDAPIPLDVNESLECEINANPAAAEQHTVIVILSDGAVTPATGQIFTINAEVTLAQLAGAWNFANISFPDSLPVGDYDVVGARVNAAGAVAFRFVPVGASNRPGGVCAQDVNDKDAMYQRMGRMGVWFTFNTVQPPGLELLGSAAAGSATYQLYIDVIKR